MIHLDLQPVALRCYWLVSYDLFEKSLLVILLHLGTTGWTLSTLQVRV